MSAVADKIRLHIPASTNPAAATLHLSVASDMVSFLSSDMTLPLTESRSRDKPASSVFKLRTTWGERPYRDRKRRRLVAGI